MTSSRPLRVLHVTPYYAPAYVYGGPTRSVPLLCEALAAAGAEVTVFTTDANGRSRLEVPLGKPQRRDGVAVTYFSGHPRSRRFAAPDLERACSLEIPRSSLVHIMGLWTRPAAAAAAAATRAGVPYVVSPRGMLMPWELRHKAWKKLPYFRLFEAPRLRRAAAIHCTTEAERDALIPHGLDRKAFIVPNILDQEEFERLPERGALRARLGIPAGAPTVLFLGRLHPKKGIEELFDAYLALRRGLPDVHLILAGPDEAGYASKLPARAPGHAALTSVHFTGQLNGKERLQAYRDADMFASLSHSENFGMTVAEAMAAGLPVVISRGVGISPWVRARGAGIVTDSDAASVSRALEAALGDGSAEMGRNGRRLVRQEFSAGSVAAAMLAAYDRILAVGSTAPSPALPYGLN